MTGGGWCTEGMGGVGMGGGRGVFPLKPWTPIGRSNKKFRPATDLLILIVRTETDFPFGESSIYFPYYVKYVHN